MKREVSMEIEVRLISWHFKVMARLSYKDGWTWWPAVLSNA